MTSRIFTGNVFLTTSKRLCNKFQESRKISNFINEMSSNERQLTFLHYPGRQNSNLIDLVYEFGSEKAKDQSFLTLRFLESNMQFERYYLEDSIENAISRKGEPQALKKVYFSFGIGDDVENWSGPFTCTLESASFTLTESGVKLITLKFIPLVGIFSRNQFIHVFGYEARLNTSNNLDKPITLYQEQIVKADNLLDQDVLNQALKDLVVKYIKSATNNMQVICILPNVETNFKTLYVDNVIKKSKDVCEALRLLGIDADYSLENVKTAYGKMATLSRIKTNPFPLHQIDPGKIFDVKNGNISLQLYCPPNKDTTLPDAWNPISTFFTKLSELFESKDTKTVGFQPISKIENDMRILGLWTKYGFIQKKDPVFILGDQRLIKRFLYPDRNFQNENKVIPFSKDSQQYGNSAYEQEYNTLIRVEEDDFRRVTNPPSQTPNAVPVFKFGTNGANVISLSYKNNANYFGILNSLNLTPEQNKAFVNAKNAAKLIQELQKIMALEQNASKSDLDIKKVKNNDLETRKQQLILALRLIYDINPTWNQLLPLDAIIANINVDKVGPSIEYFSKIAGEVISKKIFTLMQNSVLNLTIRTLPYFKISRLGVLGSLVYLVGDNSTIFNLKPLDNGSFLTGYYSILNFRHVVEKNECYSEFSLLRQFGYVNPDVDPETGQLIFPAQIIQELKDDATTGAAGSSDSSSGPDDSETSTQIPDSSFNYGGDGEVSFVPSPGNQPALDPTTEELNCGPAG